MYYKTNFAEAMARAKKRKEANDNFTDMLAVSNA